MKLHELNIASHQGRKRVGRGIGSGTGKTAGRGTKGQNSRTGGGVRPGFEGGQNPLLQRIPKVKGFKSHSPKAAVVHTDQLNSLAANTTVTAKVLAAAGLIDSAEQPVKILGRGKLGVTLSLGADVRASKTAARQFKSSTANK